MQNEERRLIEDLFEKLRAAENQSRDPDVERLLADELRRAPHAPYAMAQTIIVQNQALEAAARRIEELEDGSPDYAQGGAIPGSMGAPGLGRRGSVPSYGRPPAMGAGAGGTGGFGGGGFLASAGQVALGVAGGMLIADVARSLLGEGGAQAAETAKAAGTDDTDKPDNADNPLGEQAGADDVGGAETADADTGGGGMFGWLFGDDSQSNGADDGADGDWDSGGDGDSGGGD